MRKTNLVKQIHLFETNVGKHTYNFFVYNIRFIRKLAQSLLLLFMFLLFSLCTVYFVNVCTIYIRVNIVTFIHYPSLMRRITKCSYAAISFFFLYKRIIQ